MTLGRAELLELVAELYEALGRVLQTEELDEGPWVPFPDDVRLKLRQHQAYTKVMEQMTDGRIKAAVRERFRAALAEATCDDDMPVPPLDPDTLRMVNEARDRTYRQGVFDNELAEVLRASLW